MSGVHYVDVLVRRQLLQRFVRVEAFGVNATDKFFQAAVTAVDFVGAELQAHGEVLTFGVEITFLETA